MKNYLAILLLTSASFGIFGQSLYDYDIDDKLAALGIILNEKVTL